MKNIHVVIGVILIIGASYAFEYYTNSLFRTETLIISGVPDSIIGVEHMFHYINDGETVGQYTYTVDKTEPLYSIEDITDVSDGDESITLNTTYHFDSRLNPELYEVTILTNDEVTEINTTIMEGEFITYVSRGEIFNLTTEYSSDTLLLEINMPGYWEVLFHSADFEKGVKYEAKIFFPQVNRVFDVNLVTSKKAQNVWIGDERVSCDVIRESDLELVFYFYEGELVQLRNNEQDITFQKIIN